MASSAKHTKETIRATLDSELSLEERKSFLQELIRTPGCSTMLIEVAQSWREELIQQQIDILKSRKLVGIESSYIGAIESYPLFFLGAAERIETALGVIDKTKADISQKQETVTQSLKYANITVKLLDELLVDVPEQTETNSFAL